MLDVLIYVLPVITLIAGAFLLYSLFPAAFLPFLHHAHRPNAHRPSHGVIKRDWVATGRIDFAAQITKIKTNPGDIDKPTEFKLLVEERRIVESIAGNENLEIQWRLATLREAKAVVTQYHKYLSDNSLIKTVSAETPSLPPPVTTKDNASDDAPAVKQEAEEDWGHKKWQRTVISHDVAEKRQSKDTHSSRGISLRSRACRCPLSPHKRRKSGDFLTAASCH